MDKKVTKMKDLYLTTSQNTREQMFYNQLIEGYNLPPITAHALVDLSRSVFFSGEDDYKKLQPGQMKYYAVSINEPPGKPIKECKFIPVVLTLDTLEDLETYQKFGLISLRRSIIRRITNEAHSQKAPLTIKDLARILKVSYSTIKRDLKELNKKHLVPTRGMIKDIGPTSHKTKIVEMYIRGYTPTEIEREMHHSLTSVERYIKDFARVAILTQRKESTDNIRLIVGLSERLVNEYQDLYEKYRQEYNKRIVEITASIQIHEKAAIYKKTRVII